MGGYGASIWSLSGKVEVGQVRRLLSFMAFSFQAEWCLNRVREVGRRGGEANRRRWSAVGWERLWPR